MGQKKESKSSAETQIVSHVSWGLQLEYHLESLATFSFLLKLHFSFPFHFRSHLQFLSVLFFSSAPIPNSSLFLILFRSHPRFLSVLFSLPLPSPIPLSSFFSSTPIPNFSLFSFLFRFHLQFLSVLFSLPLPSKFLWDWMKVFLENLQCYWWVRFCRKFVCQETPCENCWSGINLFEWPSEK